MITHLTDAESFTAESLTVAGEAYRHLFRSRRLAVGAELRVVDGLGHARQGVVAAVSNDSAEVTLSDAVASNEPELRLDLLVGALRPERADFLVEKATELGATAVRFLRTERTPRNYGKGRLDRLGRVAASAVEQCQRSRLPEVTLHEWDEVEDLLAELLLDGAVFVLEPGAERGLAPGNEKRAAVVVGPEGGFTEDELCCLHELGAAGVQLGERILRVETAALAAAALLLSRR